MSRIATIARNFKAAITASAKGLSLQDPTQAWLRDLGYDEPLETVSDPYKQAVYIYTAIASIARAAARVRLSIVDQKDKPVADDHPAVRLLQQPNSLERWRAFAERTLTLRYRDGEVFWIIPTSGGDAGRYGPEMAVVIGRHGELRPARSGGIQVGWKWRRDGGEQDLALEQVCRLYFISPDSQDGCLSPTRAAELSIQQHVFASRFNVQVFKNGGGDGATWTCEGFPSPDQIKQVEDKIRESWCGIRNARTAQVLWGGLKREAVAQTMKDLDFAQGKILTRDEQLAPYFVPPIFAGIYDSATLNNSREQKLLFWDMAGIPETEDLAFVWTLFVQAKLDSDLKVVPDWSSVEALKEREMEKIDKALSFQKYGIPLNVLIETFHLPIPTQPWGDEPLVPAGQIPVSVAFETAGAAAAAENAPEGQLTALRDGFGEDLKALQTAGKEALKANAEARRARAIHDRWLASYSGLRRGLAHRLSAFFARQGEDMIGRLKAAGLPATENTESTERGQEKNFSESSVSSVASEKSVDGWITEILFELDPETRLLKGILVPQLREGAETGGQIAGEEAGAGTDWRFDLDAPAARARLSKQEIKVRDINASTARAIRGALKEGLKNGETLAEMGDRISRVMGTGEKVNRRAWNIAQTEMHEAVAGGRHEGLKQAGIEAKSWLTSGRGPVPNGPTRLSHWGAEQKTKDDPIPIEARFELIDEHGEVHECDHPGAGNLPPGERINCSCVELARRNGQGKSIGLADILANGRGD